MFPAYVQLPKYDDWRQAPTGALPVFLHGLPFVFKMDAAFCGVHPAASFPPTLSLSFSAMILHELLKLFSNEIVYMDIKTALPEKQAFCIWT